MTHQTDDAVRLTRTLEARRDVVWRMWTDPAEFAAWYGPGHATVTVTEWDLRPGGAREVAMKVQTPDGPMTMRFAGTFVEVTPPERLVYTEAMAGHDHPATRVEVDLHEDGAGTTLELVHHGIPAGSPGAAGWSVALDTLAARFDTA